MIRLTPDILLEAYAAGIFPMAESADDPELFWVYPNRRGILPLEAFHVPRRLQRVLRRGGFRLLDTQFVTPHLAQFGAIEISRARYHRLLADALRYRAAFPRDPPGAAGLGADGADGAGGDAPGGALHSSRLRS